MGWLFEVDCKDVGCMLDKWFWVEVNEVFLSYVVFYVFIDFEVYGDVFIVFRFKDFMLLFEF